MATDLKITLKKSVIGSPKKIRATATGLGLTKMNKTIMRKDTPELRGMVHKIQHLIEVEEL
ncbi:MAG: 50S ribosomal protein L30 [Desulfobulbaceae bacterium]|uniref:50S ribosomal protein L30 n=1 Tax=Candidatus Desulfobia pelagia TaxID=2841692 RepID=A0A8J6NGD7_9BACT|nr:50S ribosomal protein L30 [Candidatus Desulfobia pelagia]